MTARVDEVVEYVRKVHRDWVEKADIDGKGGDVLILSHGHLSRVGI